MFVDAAALRVKTGGGQVLEGPLQVPSGSWIVRCADPQGVHAFRSVTFSSAPHFSKLGLLLVAFGIDSIIEFASAGILVWRLTVELRRGQMFAESADKRSRCDGIYTLLTRILTS